MKSNATQRLLITPLIKELQEIYSGGNWLQESYLKKISGVDVSKVFIRPQPIVHSVAEILWHCIYWRKVTIHRLGGNTAYLDKTITDQNFLDNDTLQQLGWPRLCQQLEATQVIILSMLETKTDLFLAEQYEPGKDMLFLLSGTIQHDAYHLGQIGLILAMQKE